MSVQRQRKFIINGDYKKTLTVEKVELETTEISLTAYEPASGHQMDESPAQRVEVFISLSDAKELVIELERIIAEAS